MDIHDRRADLSFGQIPQCVAWEERVLDVGGKVDYFRKNPGFWTAPESARSELGLLSRLFFQFSEVLVYFWRDVRFD